MKQLMNSLYVMLLGVLLLVTVSVPAEAVQNGYFQGLDLIPMQGTNMRQLEEEPAVVLLFAADANSTDQTSAFDAWYRKTDRPKVNAYAVSVGPGGTPFEVIQEVLRQRDLQVPVFHVRGSDLLEGRDWRLIILDNGGKVRRSFDTLDFAAVEQELAGQGQAVAESGETTAPAPAVAIEAAPTPSTPLYQNLPYGMTIEFPPDWPYREAKNKDGAVARGPQGRLDLRVWALPNTVGTDGQPGEMTAVEYIDQFLDGLAEQNQTRVNMERRLVVEDESDKGRDAIYSYGRLIEPENPSAGYIRYRGRIQVFASDGILKVAGAEAPAPEFDAAANSVIEPFFLSFHPRVEGGTEAGSSPASAAPAPSGSAARRRSF